MDSVSPLPKDTTISIQEGDFEMDNLKRLVFCNMNMSPQLFNKLSQIYLQLMNGKSLQMETCYVLPKSGIGNLVPSQTSIAGLPNDYRKLITKGLFDYDMVSSGVRILTQIYESYNFDCQHAKHYLNNREDILRSLNTSREDAKKMVDKVVNGGHWTNDGSKITQLFKELDRNRDAFCEWNMNGMTSKYTKIFDSMIAYDKFIKKKHKTLKTENGSYITRIKDDIQSKILLSMVDYIGIDHIGALINDGLLSRKKVDLYKLEQHVKNMTDFTIRLAEKSMKPDISLLPQRSYTGIDWGEITVMNHTTDDMVEYKNSTTGEVKYSIQPIEFKKNIQCLLIDSNMGSGKTHQNQMYIQKLRHTLGRPPRIIIVSCRRLQAQDILSSYREILPDILHYEEVEKYRELHEAKSLIIQYESLWKLKGAPLHYDLFIFDECRQVLSQSTSVSTNASNIINSFDVMETLLGRINNMKCILLDADLQFDGMIRDIVKHSFKQNEVELHRYHYQPLKRQFCYVQNNDVLLNDIIQLMEEKGEETKQIAFLCFRSKTQLLFVLDKLKQLFDWANCIGIYDDCRCSDIECVKNIDKFLLDNNVHVFAITSKITVGLDIQVPFERIFGFAQESMGCTALNFTQGLARVRNVKNTEILMSVGNDIRKHTITPFKEAFKQFVNERDAKTKYANGLSQFVKWDVSQQKWQFVNSLHERMFGWSKSLDDSSFQYSFEKLCHLKQWDIKFDSRDQKKISKVKQDRNTLQYEKCEKFSEQLIELTNFDEFDEDRASHWHEINQRSKTDSYDVNDKVQNKIIHLLHTFRFCSLPIHERKKIVDLLLGTNHKNEDDPRGKDIIYLIRNRNELIEHKMYHDVFLSDELQIRLYDKKQIANMDTIGNFATMRYNEYSRMKKICDTLGETFNTKELPKIEKYFEKKSSKPITALRQTLKKIGLQLFSVGRPGTDKNRSHNYQIGVKPIIERYLPFVHLHKGIKRYESIEPIIEPPKKKVKNINTESLNYFNSDPMYI